jgi:hypothetical protein
VAPFCGEVVAIVWLEPRTQENVCVELYGVPSTLNARPARFVWTVTWIVGVGVGVGVSGVEVGLAVGVAVGVGVAVEVGVGEGVADGVAVGVGVGLGVGVGVGLVVLAVCMAIISLSDNALFQMAACWTLPLAKAVPVLSWSECIKEVLLDVLPVASVLVLVPTLTPSTYKVNAFPARLNVIECQVPSKAVPAFMVGPLLELPREEPWDPDDGADCAPIPARSLFVVTLVILNAFPAAKSVPPFKRAKNVKSCPSREGITPSALEA